MQRFEIETRDGVCPAYLHLPADAAGGPWPAILLYMDGPGIRPAIHEIAQQLADAGFAVLLPDLFYRSGPYAPIDAARVFSDPVLLKAHRERFMNPATPPRVMSDTEALLGFLESREEVAEGPIGVLGYCMGGKLALVAAGTFGDRIAVMASYHGGGLVSDQPDSPHLLAPRITAELYVAGAIEDAYFTDAHKATLEKALTDAGVAHRIETYPARHGWVPRDMPAHDPAEADHHWRTLIPLMERVLKR
jgi:carboxymethylenebutenolidase